jgi:hypothetical protein
MGTLGDLECEKVKPTDGDEYTTNYFLFIYLHLSSSIFIYLHLHLHLLPAPLLGHIVFYPPSILWLVDLLIR